MSQRKREAIRQQLVYEAVRLMHEQGIDDHRQALKKAAEHCGAADSRLWPKIAEVETALRAHQRLFRPQGQARELSKVRQEALAAMEALARFRPRLVGPAQRGTADLNTGARIWLFADSVEDVVMELIDRAVPWRQRDRPFPYADGERRAHPVVSFMVNGVPLELVILPRLAMHNPPIDPVSEHPERGLNAAEVRTLLTLLATGG